MGKTQKVNLFWKLYIGNLHMVLASCLGIQCGLHFAGSLWINSRGVEVLFQKELSCGGVCLFCNKMISYGNTRLCSFS